MDARLSKWRGPIGGRIRPDERQPAQSPGRGPRAPPLRRPTAGRAASGPRAAAAADSAGGSGRLPRGAPRLARPGVHGLSGHVRRGADAQPLPAAG